jgi:hypothetical protein
MFVIMATLFMGGFMFMLADRLCGGLRRINVCGVFVFFIDRSAIG